MDGITTYPSGLATLFSIHARNPKQVKVTREETAQAFQKMWDCQDDNEFLSLHRAWQALVQDFEKQQKDGV